MPRRYVIIRLETGQREIPCLHKPDQVWQVIPIGALPDAATYIPVKGTTAAHLDQGHDWNWRPDVLRYSGPWAGEACTLALEYTSSDPSTTG